MHILRHICTPSHRDLDTLTHVVLMYPCTWVHQNVKFPEFAKFLQEELEKRSVASVASLRSKFIFEFLDRDDCI